MAEYARKQYSHVEMVVTSLRRGRVGPTILTGWVLCMVSSCCTKEILSVSSSRISVNWPERTLSTSLRGNGADAGERIRPPDCTSSGVAVGSDLRGTVDGEFVGSRVVDWPLPVPVPFAIVGEASGMEDSRCDGGRAPRVAGKDIRAQ